jgi:hypothetical protein
MDDLEHATYVYYSRFIDIATIELACYDQPDLILERKESFSKLSREARYLYDTIISLPDEMFFKRSGVKIHKVKELLRERNWKWYTIRQTLKELREFARSL